jgi:hypothetical protein
MPISFTLNDFEKTFEVAKVLNPVTKIKRSHNFGRRRKRDETNDVNLLSDVPAECGTVTSSRFVQEFEFPFHNRSMRKKRCVRAWGDLPDQHIILDRFSESIRSGVADLVTSQDIKLGWIRIDSDRDYVRPIRIPQSITMLIRQWAQMSDITGQHETLCGIEDSLNLQSTTVERFCNALDGEYKTLPELLKQIIMNTKLYYKVRVHAMVVLLSLRKVVDNDLQQCKNCGCLDNTTPCDTVSHAVQSEVESVILRIIEKFFGTSSAKDIWFPGILDLVNITDVQMYLMYVNILKSLRVLFETGMKVWLSEFYVSLLDTWESDCQTTFSDVQLRNTVVESMKEGSDLDADVSFIVQKCLVRFEKVQAIRDKWSL